MLIYLIYQGAVLVIVSAYMAELVPEQLRGIAIGSYMMSFVGVKAIAFAACPE